MSELTARVRAHRGGFELDVSLHAPAARTLAVLGPNGAGKSTLLDVVVGRLQPDRGDVRVGGRVLSDAAARIHLPPVRRRVGLLSQAPSLFPHLSAQENVAFGPRAAGASRASALQQAQRLLDAVGLLGLEPAQYGVEAGANRIHVPGCELQDFLAAFSPNGSATPRPCQLWPFALDGCP